MSGCAAKNKTIIKVKKKEKAYLRYMLGYFSLLKIRLIETIKNGLTNSIGWNLGKKYKSIQRWALFTSTPIIGTKKRVINEKTKIIGEISKSFVSLIEDKRKIIIIPKKTNNKCLKKNV